MTLAWEFSFTDIKETEAKIKRKLRAKKIGKYDQQRVDRLRRLKDAVQTEISKCHKSKYYSKSAGEFADMKDFDTLRMTEDLAAEFPKYRSNQCMRSLNILSTFITSDEGSGGYR